MKKVNISLFSNFPNIEGPYETILEPGEVLYIPPFWFHYVSCIPDNNTIYPICISVSTISPSDVETHCGAIYGYKLDLPQNWTQDQKIIILKIYIKKLISVSLHEDTKSYIDRTLYPRYSGVLLHTLKKEFLGRGCASKLQEVDEHYVEKILGSTIQIVKELVHLISKIDKSIADICLGNYIERIIASSLNPNNTNSFLFRCLLV